MNPYNDNHYIQKTNTIMSSEGIVAKRGTRLPFYPHVEMKTEPIERENIEDIQKCRPFGTQKQVSISNEAIREADLPVTSRKRESCLIESTSNSVRVSFLFKALAKAASKSNGDPLEATILFQWMRFLMVQEQHPLMRKKPVEGYSATFLVTNKHLAIYGRPRVEDTIMGFCQKIDKECSDIKLQVNAQARYVTTEFLKAFNNSTTTESEAEEKKLRGL